LSNYFDHLLWHEPSADRLSVSLSSVCNAVHPRHRFELFVNIFPPPDSSGIRTVCVKILGINPKEFYGIMLVWGVWKIDVFGPSVSRIISKTVQDSAIVTMEDE